MLRALDRLKLYYYAMFFIALLLGCVVTAIEFSGTTGHLPATPPSAPMSALVSHGEDATTTAEGVVVGKPARVTRVLDILRAWRVAVPNELGEEAILDGPWHYASNGDSTAKKGNIVEKSHGNPTKDDCDDQVRLSSSF